jgi:hypothetical protein
MRRIGREVNAGAAAGILPGGTGHTSAIVRIEELARRTLSHRADTRTRRVVDFRRGACGVTDTVAAPAGGVGDTYIFARAAVGLIGAQIHTASAAPRLTHSTGAATFDAVLGAAGVANCAGATVVGAGTRAIPAGEPLGANAATGPAMVFVVSQVDAPTSTSTLARRATTHALDTIATTARSVGSTGSPKIRACCVGRPSTGGHCESSDQTAS